MTPGTVIFVFFGLIATGKSTLARTWAERCGIPYYNSDEVRKELAGLAPTARRQEGLDRGIYSPDFSRKTYDELLSRAGVAVRAGSGVVLDASYHRREERQRVRDLARKYKVPVYFILCTCPEPLLKERLDRRALDPTAVSDGRWEIYLQQKEKFEFPVELSAGELIQIDTQPPLERLLAGLAVSVETLSRDSSIH